MLHSLCACGWRQTKLVMSFFFQFCCSAAGLQLLGIANFQAEIGGQAEPQCGVQEPCGSGLTDPNYPKP